MFAATSGGASIFNNSSATGKLHHERCLLHRVATLLAAPLSTVSGKLKAMGIGRFKDLQPSTPVRLCQWPKAGYIIHVDNKPQAFAKE